MDTEKISIHGWEIPMGGTPFKYVLAFIYCTEHNEINVHFSNS